MSNSFLAGKVLNRQIAHKNKIYLPGDWISFGADEGGYARRLAATGKIELVDYGELMPEGVTISIVSKEPQVWASRLRITETATTPLDVKTDVGLWVNGKNPYIVKNVGAFAAIMHIENYDFFCAVDNYLMNLRQMNFPNKDVVEKLLPDLRIPVYSAGWVIWRSRSEDAKNVLQTMQSYEGVLPLNVALTLALYLHKPYLWITPVEWR